ncbi:hypothetical protein VNO78_21537 [Psophocarpus tetragonolobus]|uniref:Uncharacterized protein n=1 Tax=Psophocarpus tetragonolobus TaxID=3891 RepID=A0AAN9XI62_PSOTE
MSEASSMKITVLSRKGRSTPDGRVAYSEMHMTSIVELIMSSFHPPKGMTTIVDSYSSKDNKHGEDHDEHREDEQE